LGPPGAGIADGNERELLECAVRVPCSTSNLGAGFDCLGLALDRYLDAAFLPRETLRVQRGGTLAALDVAPEDDVLLRAFRAALRHRRVPDVAGTILMTSSIPVGRGLGSSAAATVAGIALAAAACGEALDCAAALAEATPLEGHPDNAAPALFGGLVAVVYAEHGVPRALRLPLSDRITFVFASPDVGVSTQRARAALPQQVAHSAATRNVSRMAALLYGLAHADGDAIRAGFMDELHVPYRLPLIPGAEGALRAAEEAGAFAATISGSGSGLIAACPRGMERDVREAMLAAFHDAGAGGEGFVAWPDAHGVQPRNVGTLLATWRSP
jgi:homoserine kinase